MKAMVAAVIGVVMLGSPAPARAQAQAEPSARAVGGQMQLRYQMVLMERVLEGAVEHGATVTRDRLQEVMPTATLISDTAHVRGFRLDGYGMFFDVEVPTLQGTLPWSFRTLEQNDLGLDNALKALRAHIDASGDSSLEQALKRVEIQVSPLPPAARAASAAAGSRPGAPGASVVAQLTQDAPAPSPILADPEEAYRADVRQALIDAMLDYGGPLNISADEWLTVAARRNDDHSRIGPIETDARTMVLRVRGSDIAAFRAGRLSRDEAARRVEARLF